MKTSDEKLKESEDSNRMDIIGQNGNDGKHYLSNTVASLKQSSYKLNVDNIHDIEDVKDVLESLNITYVISGDTNKVQQILINKKILERDE